MNQELGIKKKLIIGFIVYNDNTAKYLPHFLPSLRKQTFQDFKILAVDNSEQAKNENIKYLKEQNIEYSRPGKNFGFARAYNKLIQKAIELKAEYFLVINPDIILEPDAIEKMVKELESNIEYGSVSPKVLKWDFCLAANAPLTKERLEHSVIDTCGIRLKPGLKFVDIGQGEKDKGQYDKAEIIGPSGACGMYRLKALEKAKQDEEYFDELMFMYKEDCDLAYRLFFAGFKSKLASQAIIYHDRSAASVGESDLARIKARKNKSRQVKKWSFLNQQIIFAKYWKAQSIKNKLAIIRQQIKILIYIIFFEPYLFGELKNLWRVRKKIKIYQ